ncbi:MAG TPA: hypothetical protein VK866_02770 [Acidimicrobiales bacterium]|nr:hypothetical protein [Acidimicrobiales bacterium]
MAPDRSGPTPDDEAALARYAATLADGIEAALPGWVERMVVDRLTAWRGEVSPEERAEAAAAGQRARDEVGSEVRALLERDIDDQRTGPLALVRRAVVHPTAVLRAAGVPPVVRDEFAERSFPDDVYDLAPAAFADLDPALHEPGLVWGAAKAHVHLARRRAEGRR